MTSLAVTRRPAFPPLYDPRPGVFPDQLRKFIGALDHLFLAVLASCLGLLFPPRR